MTIPSLDVGHIPAAASFYSAVLQPLGLRYLSTDKDPNSPSTNSIVYGGSKAPAAIFQLQKTPGPKSINVVLSAPTSEAVSQFHQAALRAHPSLVGASSSKQFLRRPNKPDGETRARVTDLDGNSMEVVYVPPPGYPRGYAGSTVRQTECTTEEVSRILNWNYSVASCMDKQTVVSTSSSTVVSGMAYGELPPQLKRSATTGTANSLGGGALAMATKAENASGWNTTAVLGTVLGTAAGVVAGAALTYSVMKGGDGPAPGTQDQAQQVPRRATLPEVQPHQQQGYYQQPEKVGYSREAGRLALEAGPARSTVSVRSSRHAVDDIGASRYPPSAAGGRSTGSRVRSSSASATGRKPLLLTETEHRSSYAPSSSSRVVPVMSTAASSVAPSRVSRYTSTSRREKVSVEDGGRPLMANIPLDNNFAPSGRSEAGSRVSKHTSASRGRDRGMEMEDHGRPSVANIPLDGAYAPSVAPSRVSRYSPTRAPTDVDGGRPLMANIPLDGAYAPSTVPSARGSRRYSPSRGRSVVAPSDDGRPLMANIPLDNAYAPSATTSRVSRYSPTRAAEQDDGRPLMANIPLDDSAAAWQYGSNGGGMGQTGGQDYPPAPRSVTTRSSFSRSKPFDDFEIVAEDTAYVLDGGQSHVSSRSRAQPQTAQYKPAPSVGGNKYLSRGSRVGSTASARNVPLPPSTVGGRGMDEGDRDSVVPEDSISQVGSRCYR